MANETTENELNQTGEPGTEYFMETSFGQDHVAPSTRPSLQDVDSVVTNPLRHQHVGRTHGEPCAATRCSSSPAC